MTINNWLEKSTKRLQKADIGTARLDCLVLLGDEIKRDRGWILAHSEQNLQPETLKKLNRKLGQRSRHTPLAYIRNRSEFYGRNFYVDYRVLEPRPESEAIIDELKLLSLPPTTMIADIGTGSGALGITAKLEIPNLEVIAIDIKSECLKVASQNAQHLATDIQFFRGNLIEPLPKITRSQVFICNLPYVPNDFHINTAAMHEPRCAIFGGRDGLDLYRELFKQIKSRANKPSFILTEALPFQHEELERIALSEAGFICARTNHFVQLFKMDSER